MKKPSLAAIEEQHFLIGQIRQAVAWTAHLRISPHEKYTERLEGPDRADDAFAAAEKLEREHSKFGRRALVYAITRRGDTIPVSRELAALASAGENA